MNEDEVLKQVADTITDKAITITVDIIRPKWWHREKQRVFEIRGAPLRTMVHISRELIDIDIPQPGTTNILEKSYSLIEKHGERMAKIIAIAVSNPKNDPPTALVSFFYNNLTSQEMSKLLSIVFMKLNIKDFLSSIISVKGTNVLENKLANVTSASESEVSQ